MTDGFYVVAATSEIQEDGQMFVELDGEDILLVKHGGQYHAVAYLCSHAEFSLEGGSLHNGCITCPYHGAEFSLTTGEALAAPAHEPIKTYPVRVADGVISVCAVAK
jgi:3-phenylpropionate/trans-cinnamate dioxygenase ferredoxin subunit